MTTHPRGEAPEPKPHDVGQENWLRSTLSSIGDAVITTDSRSLVTFMNPVAESVTGWKQAEALGLPLETVFIIVNEDTRRAVENPVTQALRDGRIVGLANHTLLIARDGTERPIEDSAAPIRAEEGIAGVVLVFRDVTRRRRAERAALQSEERFRLLVEGVRDYAIFMLDPDGRVASWNVGAERIKGYKADEILGKHFSIFYPEEAVATGWPQEELRAAAAEGRFEDEGWRLRKDGSQFWSNVIITALRDETGTLLGFSKITRDLTERRKAEELVRDSERRYRGLFEAAKHGVLVLDASSGKISDANPFLAELLGIPRDALLGKELWEVGLFKDSDAERSARRLLSQQGYVHYDHVPLALENGQSIEVEVVGSVYKVDGEQLIQFNVRDVTERRQLELARTHAEALSTLNRRKDEFLAMLSHELRNPLAPVMNAVDLLRLEPETQVQQRARTIIERQVGHLCRLVDDLLEVSRISSGRIRLHREQLDMRDIVERAVESVRPLTDQRLHKISVVSPAEPVWVQGDPTRLEQAALNLLTNAAKYTDDGGFIQVALAAQGGEAVLRVKDNGIGIDPDLLPRIFDLFTQADRSLDRSQGGLGIGLTLVQKLVDLHRGKVFAYSQVGVGSEFVVRLPLLTAPVVQTPRTNGPSPRPARSLRLLVVDDNVDQADSLAILMRAMGHQVRVAYSGPAAVEAAIEYEPDVALLDIGLPDLDGYEVARRLRQHPRLEEKMLIAVTGYGQDTDRQRSLAAGFDHHLVKPVDPHALKALLSELAKVTRDE